MMPSSTSSFCFSSWLCRIVLLQLLLIEMICSTDAPDQHIRVDLGQDVTISCLFDVGKLEKVSFMRQMTGDILSLGSELFVHQLSSNEQIQLKQVSNNRLDLKLLAVQLNHSGVYTCMHNDEKIASYLLEISVPPRFLSYSPVEASLSFPEASPLNFSCHAHAVSPVNITWIYRNRNKQFKVLHEGEALVIDALEWSDSGSYECVASNGYHGSISRSFYVTVQYSPRLQISDERMLVEIGQTVLVKCDVCSNPAVKEIHWFRADRLLSDVNVLFKSELLLPRDRQDDQQCSQSIMEIVDLSEYQLGSYQCRAENALGEKSVDFVLQSMSPSLRMKQQEVPSFLFDDPPTSTILFSSSSNSLSSSSLFVVLLLLGC